MSAPPPQSKFNFAFGTASQVHSDSLLPSISKAIAFDKRNPLLSSNLSSVERAQTTRPVGQSPPPEPPTDPRSHRRISTQGVRKLPPTLSRSLESLLLAEKGDASPISALTKVSEQQLPPVPSIDRTSTPDHRIDLKTCQYSPESISPLSRLTQLPLTSGENSETASPSGKPMVFSLQPDVSLALPTTTFSLDSPPKLGQPVPLPKSVTKKPIPITLSSSGRSSETAPAKSSLNAFAYVRRTPDIYASVSNSADPSPPITPANFLPTARFKPPRKPAPLPPSSPSFVPDSSALTSAEEAFALELASKIPSYFSVNRSKKKRSTKGKKTRLEGVSSTKSKPAKPKAKPSSANQNPDVRLIPFTETTSTYIASKKVKKKKKLLAVPVGFDDTSMPKSNGSTAPVSPSSPMPSSSQSGIGNQDTIEAQVSRASSPSTLTRHLETSSIISSADNSTDESVKGGIVSPDWTPVRFRRDLMGPGRIGTSCRSVDGYSLCDIPEDAHVISTAPEGKDTRVRQIGERLDLREGWSGKKTTRSMQKPKNRKETKREKKERKRLEEEMFDMDRPPTEQDMIKAASCEVVDGDGISHSFGDLVQDQRTIVIFIRHWFCPLCQDFMYHIVREADPEAISRAGSKLIIIGNGKHTVIHGYQKKVFKSPFQLFTDPSLELYRALGMTRQTSNGGPEDEKGEYVQHTTFTGTLSVMRNIGKQGVKGLTLNPGHMNQLGGEMVIGPNLKIHYTHRMSTTRGHAPITIAMAYAGALSTEEHMVQSTSWTGTDVSWKADRDGEMKRMRDWKAERRRGRLLITKLENGNQPIATHDEKNVEQDEGSKERSNEKIDKLSERPIWSPPVVMSENYVPGLILTPPQGDPKELAIVQYRSRSSTDSISTGSDDHDLASSFVGFPSPPVHTLGFVKPPSPAILKAVQATTPILPEFEISKEWDVKELRESEGGKNPGLALGIKEEEHGLNRIEQLQTADVTTTTTLTTAASAEKQISSEK